MIAFTISLTDNDWDETLSGWRCPVLRIPGAQVDALYAGSKIDDAWYKIDPLQAIVRWVHGKAPNQAALAVRLTQDLSPKEVTLFWKKLAIVVPILAALVTGLIGWATRPAVKTGNSGAYYETWSLRGKVKIDKDMFPHYQVQAMIRPPSLPLMADGSFKEDIPVRNRANGSRDFTIARWCTSTTSPNYRRTT